MNQTRVVDTQHEEFPDFWRRLNSHSDAQSPYKVNAAFTELQNSLGPCESSQQTPANKVRDLSFVVVQGSTPLMGCCLILQELPETGRTLGCKGLFATSEFESTGFNANSNNIETSVFSCLNVHLDELMADLRPDLVEFFDTMRCGVMSPVSHWLLAEGAVPILCPVQIIDLSKSRHSLMQGLEKTHYDSVCWAQDNVQFRIIDTAAGLNSSIDTANLPDDDRYVTVTTDPSDCFQQQASNSYYCSLLDSKKAFIIQAFADNDLVASTTFSVSQGSAHYISSILSGWAKSNPVLEGLAWEGIKHAKTLGLGAVELTSSAAEAQCGQDLFSGFGGTTQTRFKLLLTT